MSEVLLNGAEILGAPQQFDGARVTERVGMKRLDARPFSEVAHKLPDAMARHPRHHHLSRDGGVADPEQRFRRGRIRTLAHAFEYPRLGPGMMWDACRDRVVQAGGTVTLGARIVEIAHDARAVTAVVVDLNGERRVQPASHVISTMPMRDLIAGVAPAAPEHIRRAAARLAYRDFLTVALVVDQADVFPDNWIYVHDPSVRVGRVQNFKNWSAAMVPDPARTCLGLEYFCTSGDALWAMDDGALVALAARELDAISLARRARVLDGTVLRVHKAYPVYDAGYRDAVAQIRAWVERFSNLQLVGRNGMHKYNNQDHSMLTARLAVRNVFGERHDLWAVNADDEYHEDGGERATSSAQRCVPQRIRAENG